VSGKTRGWNTLGKSIGAPLFRGVVVTPLIFPPEFQPLPTHLEFGESSQDRRASDPTFVFAVRLIAELVIED
jgi:hypothetical protein